MTPPLYLSFWLPALPGSARPENCTPEPSAQLLFQHATPFCCCFPFFLQIHLVPPTARARPELCTSPSRASCTRLAALLEASQPSPPPGKKHEINAYARTHARSGRRAL
ncbi:hypothetical protein DFH11DRAFT_1607640 [Phellopilus nigrolimitatus]|nr:hypothetical protein DFH11DRAFT_1607626 [Phellopilus nigrolimitatus]KAH8112444.1 hypothetical protein DFH11DRAFT_1607640 [Phellopilus nigrolimitatus]